MRGVRVVLAAVACLAASAFALEVDTALESSRAAVGATPGDFALTDTGGRRVPLSSFRGRPLVVSFVYTGCSQVCPTTTRSLAKAVATARSVVGRDAFDVVSIGFDVPSDNPVSMRVFARQHAIDDPRWTFLVPDAGAAKPLLADFGFAYEARTGAYDHLMQVTILDAKGRVHAQLYGEALGPLLVPPLKELVLGEPAATVSMASLVDRVRLLCTVYDPVTGKYRLDYALFFEVLAGVIALGATAIFLVRERRRARRLSP
jgi:protein SCO1/2